MEEKLDEIRRMLHEMNVNLEKVRVSLSSLVQITDDHETRLRAVEKWQTRITPLMVALTFLLGAISREMIRKLL